jgi:hypothetical protein
LLAADRLPHIPGLVRCGTDLTCFLQALDSGTPAAVIRNETAEEMNAMLTAASTWWATKFTAERCVVSFLVEAFEAKGNEKIVQRKDKATRDTIEARIAEANRDFGSIRGKTATCTLAAKDLKAVMTSPSLSLMSLGPTSSFGRNCSGAGFGLPRPPSSNDKR